MPHAAHEPHAPHSSMRMDPDARAHAWMRTELAHVAFGQLKNSAGEAKCLQALGKKRKDASGVELLELSLSKQREMGDRVGEAACLYDLGCAQDEQGDTDTAIEWLQVKKSNLPNGSKRNHCNFEWAAGLRRREEGARRRVRRRRRSATR